MPIEKRREVGRLGAEALKKMKEENPAYYQKLLIIWRNNFAKGLGNRWGHTFEGCHHTEETKRRIGEKNSIKQKGELNSHYGTCWIYNEELKKSKAIQKTELNEWIKKGWKKGRKIKFD